MCARRIRHSKQMQKLVSDFGTLSERRAQTLALIEKRKTNANASSGKQDAGQLSPLKQIDSDMNKSLRMLVESFVDMADYCRLIRATKCENLKCYVISLIKHQHDEIKLILKRY